KVSWKPLRCPEPAVTCTLVSASATSRCTRTGTTPIISVTWMPLSMAPSRHALAEGETDALSRHGHQLVRPHHHVRVAQAPVQLGVGEGVGGDGVGALAFEDAVLLDRLERLGRRDDP